jgi:uncharacterized protein (DUF1501 family)
MAGRLTTLSRRGLIGLGAAGLLVPRFGFAESVAGSNRRFVFVHCRGGWDTTYVFQPNFGSSVVDMESDSEARTVNGIEFVDNPNRSHVPAFFQIYGDRTCIVNGIEVRSVTHERCARIMMTGSAEGSTDDWGAILAGESTSRQLLPYFVLSGTAFTARYSSRVVRVGESSQLEALTSGTALSAATQRFPVPDAERDALVDALVRKRMAARAEGSPIARAAASALDDVEALKGYADTLNISSYVPGGCYQLANQLAAVFDVFELGLARTALVEYRGWCSEGWDTHANNDRQALHFNELFEYLAIALQDLDSRPSASGGRLADETVVVIVSEMGRTPQLNPGNGRDHWTFTSAMVIGAGVRGGQVVGGFDDSGFGAATDFASGEVLSDGPGITAANFGATLLALGDVDPGETAPITAVLA